MFDFLSYDVIRELSLFPAALTYALSTAVLVISFKVLKPKVLTWQTWWGSGAGFLWTHIVAVTIPFQGFVTWGIIEVLLRFNEPPSFRPLALIVLTSIINLGYLIIFRIELARLRLKRAGSSVV